MKSKTQILRVSYMNPSNCSGYCILRKVPSSVASRITFRIILMYLIASLFGILQHIPLLTTELLSLYAIKNGKKPIQQ